MQQMCLTADQTIEEMISNLEERLLENIQTEVQREKMSLIQKINPRHDIQ